MNIHPDKVPAHIALVTLDVELRSISLGHLLVLMRVVLVVRDCRIDIVVVVFLARSLVHDGRLADGVDQSDLDVPVLPVVELIQSRSNFFFRVAGF